MSIKLGSTDIASIKLGNTALNGINLGSSEAFSTGSGAAALVTYQRMIPGGQLVNEATGNQAMIPGGQFVNGI